MLEVWCDGSSRGNPGVSGIGIYCEKDGKSFKRYAKLIGNNRTNNEAEYEAIIESIEMLLINNGSKDICIIYTDSALVYGHLKKRWKCKHKHLQILLEKVRNLLEKADFAIDISWNMRYNVSVANDLAQGITLREVERIKNG